jgi:hypothetical protein
MTSRTFEYDNGPIAIGDHAWVGAQAMILPQSDGWQGCCRGCSMQGKP